VDLSAIIFVVLALAWAVYLIPKALKHHDEMASDRLVEGHSDKVRILSRKSGAGNPEVVEVEVEHVDTVETTVSRPRRPQAAPLVTRAAARRAAQRRRRVLAVLLLALAVVAGLAAFAIVPWWSTAIPGAMVVLFLVVARLSVRRLNARRAGAARAVVEHDDVEPVETGPQGSQDLASQDLASQDLASQDLASQDLASQDLASQDLASQDLVDLLTEDTIGVPRQELEAALADDGSLWDPLPMTLPTYVNKARARRTVRTIELTGISSSGHDQADTALAREAQESASEPAAAETGSRKAAGA
jgi:hypothetical protein